MGGTGFAGPQLYFFKAQPRAATTPAGVGTWEGPAPPAPFVGAHRVAG